MAGRIPQGFIDDLLARVNIVDIIDGRVKLKKAGKTTQGSALSTKKNRPLSLSVLTNSSITVLLRRRRQCYWLLDGV